MNVLLKALGCEIGTWKIKWEFNVLHWKYKG